MPTAYNLNLTDLRPGDLLEIAYYSFGYTDCRVVKVLHVVAPGIGTSGETWVVIEPTPGIHSEHLSFRDEWVWLEPAFKKLDYVRMAQDGAAVGKIPQTTKKHAA